MSIPPPPRYRPALLRSASPKICNFLCISFENLMHSINNILHIFIYGQSNRSLSACHVSLCGCRIARSHSTIQTVRTHLAPNTTKIASGLSFQQTLYSVATACIFIQDYRYRSLFTISVLIRLTLAIPPRITALPPSPSPLCFILLTMYGAWVRGGDGPEMPNAEFG